MPSKAGRANSTDDGLADTVSTTFGQLAQNVCALFGADRSAGYEFGRILGGGSLESVEDADVDVGGDSVVGGAEILQDLFNGLVSSCFGWWVGVDGVVVGVCVLVGGGLIFGMIVCLWGLAVDFGVGQDEEGA